MEGTVVVVTGSGAGIGKEIATGYARLGASVMITDVNIEAGEALERKLQSEGKHAQFVRCDVRDVTQIEQLFRQVEAQFGKLDILINNAGVSRWMSPYEMTVEAWDDVIQTNLRSVFFCAKEAALLMRKKKKGSIVNIASTRAMMSEPNSEAYAASKGGIVSLTHALAASFQDDGIQVNAISPGWIEISNYETLREADHNQHFAKRVGKPEDIFRACLFLTSENNDFITATNITVDGGMTKKMIYED